jgi:hypothetical protein
MKKLAFIATLLFAMPIVAGAAYFSAEETIIPPDKIDQDFFAAGNIISIHQNIAGDSYLAAENITVAGDIAQDVFAAGNTIVISGRVGDDIMAVGNTVSIESLKVDDLFAAGNNITISDKTIISGDAYVAGNQVTVNGVIDGTLRSAAEHLILGPNSHLTGDLIIYGDRDPTLAAGSLIDGQIIHRLDVRATNSRSFQLTLLNWVRGVVTWFIVALVLMYLAPRHIQNIQSQVRKSPGRSFAIGIIGFILAIPVSIFLLITVVGVPLALVTIFFSLLTFSLALIHAPILIGSWSMQRLSKQSAGPLSWQHILLGAVLFKTIPIIPIVGSLLLILIVVLVFGALLIHMWELLRGAAKKPGKSKNI